MPRRPANCYIIAGPNGAGKTTFATTFLPVYADCRNFINLFTIYRPLLDTLHFFDNSSDRPRLIFKDEACKITINDAALYQRVRQGLAL